MKIAIAGFGAEGKANYSYWNTTGNEVVIVDEREILEVELPVDASTVIGEGVFSRLDDFDMVVRTAGLAPHKIKTNGKIWSATNEFFAKCPAQIIGVTGTKGKGTTCSFITSILRAAGKTVHLVGNIGVLALEELPKIQPSDIVVYELSSFQLWDLEKSPHIAVVLGIEPDHMDVHASFDDYFWAKANIAKQQIPADSIVYNKNNQWSFRIAETSLANTVIEYPFDLGELGSHVQLPGVHNLENASAAVAVARLFTDDESAIARGLEEFTGLPHRLKLVGEVGNVKFYDDSISTTPGSAIAALKAFESAKVIILGGSDKGAEYNELIGVCKEMNAKVLAIGQTGVAIAAICHEQGVAVTELGMADIHEVVKVAFEQSLPGGVVLLSPASASFDQYKNYTDRGDQFIAAVKKLS